MATLMGLLSLTTLGFVLAFAYIAKRATERNMREGGVRSTLCATSQHWDPSFRADRKA
ncbi:MAG: hypothetical protein AAFY65_17340 [Pseudomonadota bacterium]